MKSDVGHPITTRAARENAITLKVNGRKFAGWKTARITTLIEAIAGSFELGASEKWNGQTNPWPIIEEDECELVIYDQPVISGWVDTRDLEIGPESSSFECTGKDRTGAMVENSALLNDNGSGKSKKKATWEFASMPLLSLAKKLGAVHGISVKLSPPDLQLPAPAKKLSVEPGDTLFEVLERACRLVGVLPISDGAGGLVLMRPGSSRTHDALIEGQNFKGGTARYDFTGRFRTYVVHGQHPGSDFFSGAAASQITAEATDMNVRRADRVLLIRAENALTVEYAKARAQWEASVRAARSANFSLTVQGWRQGNGAIWPVNALVPVQSRRLGVNGDLLITKVDFTADGGGELAHLTLKPPSAFQPEPVLPSGAAGDRTWKEIRKGV